MTFPVPSPPPEPSPCAWCPADPAVPPRSPPDPIQLDHGLAVEQLPWIHRDPHRCAEDGVFDRLLVAQAALEGLRLLTTDRTLSGYGEPVRWVAG